MAADNPVLTFPDLASASEALANAVAERLLAVLDMQETASLALPGGQTPLLFLAALGRRPLAWERITVLPGDERFVAPDNPHSNEGQIRRHFAPLATGRCQFTSLRGTAETPEIAASEASAHAVFVRPLDLAICGMGADGHVASLFPGEAMLRDNAPVQPAVITTNPPGLTARLTLSPMALQAASWRGLLFAGADKAGVFERACQEGSPLALPVRLLLAAGCTTFIARSGQPRSRRKKSALWRHS